MRPDAEVSPTPLESLMYKTHCGSSSYYRTKIETSNPKLFPIPFPAYQICICSNNSPIVTNIDEYLQESERKQDREECFFTKFAIHPQMLLQIGSYTLGRVIKRNSHQHFAYSKIIHSQLNTMTINKRWKLGTDICLACHKEIEDWYHVLNCRSDDLTRVREEFIKNFRLLLKQNSTYPPTSGIFRGMY